MIAAFWNMRGAGKKGMSTSLTNIIKDFSVDFIGLKETISKNILLRSLENLILRMLSSGSGCLLVGNLVVFYVVPDMNPWKFKLSRWGSIWL